MEFVTAPPVPNLEFSADEMRRMADAVMARSIEHVASLGAQPVLGDVNAREFCRALREPAPEAGCALEPLLDQLFDDYIPRSFNAPAPGYLAFIPGGGVFPAALADFITNTANRFTGLWQTAPALVQLEANALDWLRDWMGFPETTRGLFTAGGSMATFNALLCARERYLGADIRRGVIYTSDQAHHSVLKAAKIAGVMPDRVRALPCDERYRLPVSALAEAIAADRRAGLLPFAVVSSAGTTNTGAVDPLPAIADLCTAEGLWHHVDGAYGAFFNLCDEGRAVLEGLDRADSLTLDPHKGMFLPYGTGALLVRDGAALRAAHEATAALHAGHAASRRLLRSEPARPGPVTGFPWAPRVADGEAVWRGGLPRGHRGEARARTRRASPAGRAPRSGDRRGARAVALRISRDLARRLACRGRCRHATAAGSHHRARARDGQRRRGPRPVPGASVCAQLPHARGAD